MPCMVLNTFHDSEDFTYNISLNSHYKLEVKCYYYIDFTVKETDS